MKRAFDIIFSILALFILFPVLVPVAIVLRLTGEGEVFFTQARVGAGGEMFNLYKFATMLKNSPSLGTGTVTVRDDPRILPLGRWLRKSKINELPQVLNILFGDMSVVGPRPLTPQAFDAFPEHAKKKICEVRPGLSGVGSIVFRREEDILFGSDSQSFYREVIAPYKGELEVWFVSNDTVLNYFKIIFLTFIVVLAPKSRLVWSFLQGLPHPPEELKGLLGFSHWQDRTGS